MGFSLSWVAVSGKSPEEVRQQLGLRGTGKRAEVPESPLVDMTLPNGWHLVVANKSDHFVSEDVLHPLSQHCNVVACFVEEHVMCSFATQWTDSKFLWSIWHDSQKGIGHLDIQGEAPPAFEAIRTRLYAEQEAEGSTKAKVDFIFDVPIDLAQSLVGYRYDFYSPEWDLLPYEVLEIDKSKD